ncbi:hypothetical protein JCM8547_000660 [Rhodosporidiobolus lusitaniae]
MSSPSSPSSSPSSAYTYLPSHVPSLRCSSCALELALQDELVSRSFQGTSGPALLFRSAVNVKEGKKIEKQLISGKHTIAAVFCKGCGSELGWKYYVSPDSSQKFKEGKWILEKRKIYKDNKWSIDEE